MSNRPVGAHTGNFASIRLSSEALGAPSAKPFEIDINVSSDSPPSLIESETLAAETGEIEQLMDKISLLEEQASLDDAEIVGLRQQFEQLNGASKKPATNIDLIPAEALDEDVRAIHETYTTIINELTKENKAALTLVSLIFTGKLTPGLRRETNQSRELSDQSPAAATYHSPVDDKPEQRPSGIAPGPAPAEVPTEIEQVPEEAAATEVSISQASDLGALEPSAEEPDLLEATETDAQRQAQGQKIHDKLLSDLQSSSEHDPESSRAQRDRAEARQTLVRIFKLSYLLSGNKIAFSSLDQLIESVSTHPGFTPDVTVATVNLMRDQQLLQVTPGQNSTKVALSRRGNLLQSYQIAKAQQEKEAAAAKEAAAVYEG